MWKSKTVRTRDRGEETLRQILVTLTLAGVLVSLGAFGYHRLEGWSWGDSFYMVFITLSTVGFSEVHPLSHVGRVWTIFLVVGGVTAIGYIAARAIEFLTEGSLRGYRRLRRMQKRIENMQDHYIICGYGRVGRQVVNDFLAANASVGVVDQQDRDDILKDQDIPHVIGNAESEATLETAGIERASGLVACVDSDTENVFITLTARQLNPRLRVIARSSNNETARKLRLVGAEHVVSPYLASGRRMAQLALRPHTVDFFDVLSDPLQKLGVEMQEFAIEPAGKLAGRSLRELDLRRSTGVIVVALRHADDIELNPDPDAVLDPGSRLITMGTADQCASLAAMNLL
jgi:voltage-gated potassium channel